MRKKPPYPLASVDNALVLATVLRTEGSLTVTEAARRLGVAPSTAHRLLAMLVYRDFAVQDSSRQYRPGPAFSLEEHQGLGTGLLRESATPHLEALASRTGESVNLVVRVGEFVHFIASWESTKPLRVGSREGMTFPAHLTSGGLVLLSQLTDAELVDLYSEQRWAGREAHRPDLVRLQRELAGVRRSGVAVQRNRSESGVSAVGISLGDTGLTPAALSVSMPTLRFDPTDLEHWVRQLRTTVDDIRGVLRREMAARSGADA
jgi:IclR family transcriptional regulator, acetate operon repressor